MIHPVTLAAVVVLAVNDHLLKARYSGPVTGKLSDLAGLLVLPPLLALALVPLVPRRSPSLAAGTALVLTAACFTAVKATDLGAHAASAVWSLVSGPSVVLADRTDLLALPALAVSAWAWTRTRRRPPSSARLRRIEVFVVLPAAAVAVAATTAPYSPEAVAVGTWRGMIVGGEANVFDGDRRPERWSLSHDGRVWRSMTAAEMSAFEEQRSGSDYTARQSCVPADPDRCYRVVPGHLSVVTTTDGGASWSTSWEVPDGRRTYLARQQRALSTVDVVAHLSAQAVAVLPTAGEGHLVVVANGPDGYAVRDPSGRWERVGFGATDGGYESPPAPLSGGFWVILPETVLAVVVGLLVLAIAGLRLSVATRHRVTGSTMCLVAGLLLSLGGAAGLASPNDSILDLAQLPAVVLGIAVTLIGVVGGIPPGARAAARRRRLLLVLIVALGTTGVIIGLFGAWSHGLMVDYRPATIMALVAALGGTSLAAKLAGPATSAPTFPSPTPPRSPDGGPAGHGPRESPSQNARSREHGRPLLRPSHPPERG